MDKRIIKGLIDEKLEVIQEQFSIIREYEGKIPIIEVDLFMTSIRDLYELVLSLHFENIGGAMPKAVHHEEAPVVAPPPGPVVVEKPVEVIPEPEIARPEIPVTESPFITENRTTVRFSSGIISMEPVMHNEISTHEEPVAEAPPPEKFEPYIPEPPVTAYVPPGPEPEPEPETPATEQSVSAEPDKESSHDRNQPHEKYQRITFDLFSDGAGSTLADRLREGQEKRVADKLQENKVVDLRTSIGINDKFLFINELFEGNMRIYDEAIQKLNTSSNMAQAELLMLDLKIVYNWESESPTVKKFVELVRRKF
jgi:hypothetical protein